MSYGIGLVDAKAAEKPKDSKGHHMKREGFIFERIACPANIRRAIHKAAIGKTDNRLVRNVLEHEDEAVVRVREILLSGFKPSPYKRSIIFDGANKKQREILKPRFYPDQIIHWALIMQIQSAIMRGMYDWSCCSIPGRGQSRCKQGVERWLKGDPENTKYCLKIDIRKFYPSVDNQILKASFRRIIKDARTLSLIDAIIDSTKGLNIGNYTSQWFANFYLQPVDHFIKEKLRHTVRNGKRGSKPSDAIIYYARYNDDMVMFGRNKKALRNARDALFAYLQDKMHLTVKDNWQLFLVTCVKRRRDGTTYKAGRDVDFLGFRMNHECTTLRRKLSLRMARRARKIYKKKRVPNYADCAAMISYCGWLKHSDSHNFYTKRISPYVNIEAMKGIVSNEARAKQRQAAAIHR